MKWKMSLGMKCLFKFFLFFGFLIFMVDAAIRLIAPIVPSDELQYVQYPIWELYLKGYQRIGLPDLLYTEPNTLPFYWLDRIWIPILQYLPVRLFGASPDVFDAYKVGVFFILVVLMLFASSMYRLSYLGLVAIILMLGNHFSNPIVLIGYPDFYLVLFTIPIVVFVKRFKETNNPLWLLLGLAVAVSSSFTKITGFFNVVGLCLFLFLDKGCLKVLLTKKASALFACLAGVIAPLLIFTTFYGVDSLVQVFFNFLGKHWDANMLGRIKYNNQINLFQNLFSIEGIFVGLMFIWLLRHSTNLLTLPMLLILAHSTGIWLIYLLTDRGYVLLPRYYAAPAALIIFEFFVRGFRDLPEKWNFFIAASMLIIVLLFWDFGFGKQISLFFEVGLHEESGLILARAVSLFAIVGFAVMVLVQSKILSAVYLLIVSVFLFLLVSLPFGFHKANHPGVSFQHKVCEITKKYKDQGNDVAIFMAAEARKKYRNINQRIPPLCNVLYSSFHGRAYGIDGLKESDILVTDDPFTYTDEHNVGRSYVDNLIYVVKLSKKP